MEEDDGKADEQGEQSGQDEHSNTTVWVGDKREENLQIVVAENLVVEPVQDQIEPEPDALSETDEYLRLEPDEDPPSEPENDQSRQDVIDTPDLKVHRLYMLATSFSDIKHVLQFDGDLNMTNSAGQTALDIARDVMSDEKAASLLEEAGVKSAHVKLSKQLETENKENLNVKQILNAAKLGDPGTLRTVVSSIGTSIDAVDTENRTALMLAVDTNEVVAAATLGQSHALVSEDILDTAIRGGGEDMVQTLLTCAELSTQGGCGAGNKQPAAVDEIKERELSNSELVAEDMADIQKPEKSGTDESLAGSDSINNLQRTDDDRVGSSLLQYCGGQTTETEETTATDMINCHDQMADCHDETPPSHDQTPACHDQTADCHDQTPSSHDNTADCHDTISNCSDNNSPVSSPNDKDDIDARSNCSTQ